MASSEGSQKKTKKEIRQERIERLEHARVYCTVLFEDNPH